MKDANFTVTVERGGWELEVLGEYEEAERPTWGHPGTGEQLEILQIVLVGGEGLRVDITDLVEECGGMALLFEDVLDALRDREEDDGEEDDREEDDSDPPLEGERDEEE